MDKAWESLLKRFLDASNLTVPDAAVCTGALVFVSAFWWYLGDDKKTKTRVVRFILYVLAFLCPSVKVLTVCFKGFQVSWVYQLVTFVVSLVPAAALIKWLPSSAWSGPTRETAATDNGKKTSDSTSTEPVGQPGRGDLPLSDLHKRAEEKATQEELQVLARKIEAVWFDFASYLDPDMFTAAKTSVIRKNAGLNSSELICAKTMLENWAQNRDIKATRRRLIEAMYESHLIAEARKVFETTHKYHGLVEYVLKSTGGK